MKVRWDEANTSGLRIPPGYLQCNYHNREHQAAHFDVAESLLPKLDGLTLLDVGCGYGDFTRRLPKDMRDRYLGIDVDENMIKAAKEIYPGWKFRCTKRITKADVIVGVAAIAAGVEPPQKMLADMWAKARKAVVFTVWEGMAPMELLVQMCPAPPDVILASRDFFAGAMYK